MNRALQQRRERPSPTDGRYPVHIDLSRDYLRLARWRIYESGHASKTVERTNREAQGVLLKAADRDRDQPITPAAGGAA